MKRVLAAAVVFFVLGVHCACAPARDVVVAVPADPTTLDPHMHYRTPDESVCSNIFDSLMTLEPSGSIVPGLAVSWSNVGSTRWRLKIRRGVRFHNGEVLDPECVKFSLERVLDPDNRSPQKSVLRTVSRVEVSGPDSVDVITSAPDPILPARLCGYAGRIVPRRYLQEVGSAHFAANPVGTGPYRFVRWRRDSEIVLEAFAGHWRGAPRVHGLVFRTAPEASARFAALVSGEVDIVAYLPPDLIPAVNSRPGLAVRTVQTNRLIRVALDCRNGPTADRRVRLAMNYAVDFGAIMTHVLGGAATRLPITLGPDDFGFDPEIKPYPYDPARAKGLLEQAGFPDGFAIDFDAPTGRFLKDAEVAAAIAGQLKRVGIAARLRTYEPGTFVQRLNSDSLAPMYLHGWSNPLMDADGTFTPLYRTGERLARFSNPELDRTVDAARNLLSGPERQRLYREACRIVYAECPDIFAYRQHDVFAVRRSVDWTPRTDELVWGYDMSVADDATR